MNLWPLVVTYGKVIFKLYERLSPLGCKTEDGRILMYSEATEGEHFTKEDWIKFIEYRRTFRELPKYLFI